MPQKYRKASRERSRLIQNRNIRNRNSLGCWDNLEYVTRKSSGLVFPRYSWYLIFFLFFSCGLGCCRLNREQGQEKKADPVMDGFGKLVEGEARPWEKQNFCG